MKGMCGLAWLAAISLFVSGCGKPPHISKANVKLVEQLRTAVAAKRTDWVDLASKQAEEHRRSGTLSGAESETVGAIVNEAQQGHWDESNRRMSWLIRGQQ
jgi:hypothetical protein